jgi:hypothetical protein
VARHAIEKNNAGRQDQPPAPDGGGALAPPPAGRDRDLGWPWPWPRPGDRGRPSLRRQDHPALGRPAGGAGWPARRQFARHWLLIFGGSLSLLLLRFLVPSPVGLADDGDGARLMCGLGVAPVTGGHQSYDAYAFFRYALSPGTCSHAAVYQSSEHLLLVAAQWLTPVLGLPGRVSLIALGILTCGLVAVGIASLACGLGTAVRGRLAVAGGLWLVMADATFFDNYASPYSEGATLTGLLLVAAGLVYLGRGRLASAAGLVLAGAGGYLAILSKEQYLVLIVPVVAGLLLAAVARDGRRGLGRVLTGRLTAAVLAAALLATATVAYARADATSPYPRLLHQEQVVDVIFSDIVPRHSTIRAADADLRALGLPTAWESYAGHSFWARRSVYGSPLYPQYASKLTDTNLARFLLTHPLQTVDIAQHAAAAALQLRVTDLGNYAPGANLPPGTLENRIAIVSSIVGVIPAQLGLFWLIPLWAVMLALAVVTLRRPRRVRWHHDAAVAALTLTIGAIVAFVPAALFAGTDTTRHMLGADLATALAFAISISLLSSLLRLGLAQDGHPAQSQVSVPWPRPGEPLAPQPLAPQPRGLQPRGARARS